MTTAVSVFECSRGVSAEDPEPEGPDGAAAGLGQPRVAPEDLGKPLLLQHRDRFAEAEEERRGGRVGELAALVPLEHRAPVPVGARALGGVARADRPLARGQDREARREHEALLGAGQGDVHPPLVEPEVDRRQGRDDVDEEERRVARLVEGPAHRRDVARHPRRGLVVDDEDRADLVGRVGAEPLGHAGRRRALAIGHLEAVHLDAERRGGPAEVVREVAVDDAEDPVTGRQRVHDGRFPAARARARVHDRLAALGLEHGLEPGQDLADQRRELRAAVVDDRLRHGAHDPLGNEGGAGDLQERPTGHARLLPARRASCAVGSRAGGADATS